MADYEFEADIYTEGIFDAEMTAGGATPVSDYEVLNNKPKINGVMLVGNKTSEQLGIITEDDVANLVEGYRYATVSALEAEVTARENADNSLSDRIDAEATARENADNELLQKIENTALTASAQGESLTFTDAADNCGLYSLYIEGKSVQNGTPTPDNPIEIDSIGDSGSFAVTTDDGGEISTTATITSALPLCAVGDVKDELIFNADGTAKIVKRTAIEANLTVYTAYAITANDGTSAVRVNCGLSKSPSQVLGEKTKSKSSHFVYNGDWGVVNAFVIIGDGTLYFQTPSNEIPTASVEAARNWINQNNVKFVYPLQTPEEINLTADETAALLALETYEGLTNVFNSDNAQMSVEYWRNQAVGSLLTSISRNTNSRLTALENAIIGG